MSTLDSFFYKIPNVMICVVSFQVQRNASINVRYRQSNQTNNVHSFDWLMLEYSSKHTIIIVWEKVFPLDITKGWGNCHSGGFSGLCYYTVVTCEHLHNACVSARKDTRYLLRNLWFEATKLYHFACHKLYAVLARFLNMPGHKFPGQFLI